MEPLLKRFANRAEALGSAVVVVSRDGLAHTLAADWSATTSALEWLGSGWPTKGENTNVVALARLGVAETGSVLLVEPAAERAACLLAEHLWVILPSTVIVPTLSEALANANSLVTTGARSLIFISGPSRTGDIERVLTIGVHGPAALTILVVSGP